MGTIRQIDSTVDDRKCGCVILYLGEFELEGLESGSGELRFKLNARSMICYPSTTLHRVLPVTRGQRLVVLVGDPRALAVAVSNAKPQARFTRLAQRLTARA